MALYDVFDDGIVFGGHRFSEPELLPTAAFCGLPDPPGLYVVLGYDVGWSPRPFRPLYFGESDGIWGRSTVEHEKLSAWRAEVGAFGAIYRAVYSMPGSTRLERQAAESALIREYGTPCNERLSLSLEALLGRRSPY